MNLARKARRGSTMRAIAEHLTLVITHFHEPHCVVLGNIHMASTARSAAPAYRTHLVYPGLPQNFHERQARFAVHRLSFAVPSGNQQSWHVVSTGSHDRIGKCADTFNGYLAPVTMRHEHGWFAGDADASGRSRTDHIPRLKRHHLAQEMN